MKKEIEKIKKLSFSDNIENNNNNNKITFYSKIINNINEFQFVLNKIEKLSSKEIKSLQLLYRASEYSYSGQIFHQKCDGITPTIVIIHSKNNYKFGGYTEKSWECTSKDDNAFCFSINLKKKYNIIKGRTAIGKTNGPIFYGDCYNFIQINENSGHIGNKKTNYEGVESDFEINGGQERFFVLDYEVFQVIF